MRELHTQNEARTRVAFFLPDLEMGGAERVFLTLASALAQRGYAVELILARKHGLLLAEVDPLVKLINLNTYQPEEHIWRFGLRTVFQLTRHLRKTPPHVLFSTLTGANITAIVARLLSRQTFHLCIREASTLANVQSKLRLHLMRRLYPLADHMIVLTAHAQKQLSTTLKLTAGKMVVIGNPIDAEKINQFAREPELVLQTKKSTPYAVCVGRMAEPKDFSTVIKAIQHINQMRTINPLNLVLVGDGPMKLELQHLTKTLGQEDHVYFAGMQTNPYPWIADASVFVLSSRWEGYPNVLLEAQCLGIPIVATGYDDSLRTLLHDTEHTRIVDVGDDEAMATAIQWATEAPRKTSDIKGNKQFEEVLNAYMNLIPLMSPTQRDYINGA